LCIFGTLISFGVYFAFDWGGAIVNMTKANPTGEVGLVAWGLIRKIFATESQNSRCHVGGFFFRRDHAFWAALDAWLIKDTPEEAGFPHLDYRDASSGQMHIELSMFDLAPRK